MRWMIMCNECCPDPDDESVTNVFNAEDGYQGEDEEGSILACEEWNDRRHLGTSTDKYFCDDCGCPIAVPITALWFINNHREERESYR